MAKTIADTSIDTTTIERFLSQVSVGHTVPYETLTTLIGRDVTGKARHILNSAIRRLRRDQHQAFAAVRGVGVQRLDDVQIASSGQAGVRKITGVCRRSRAVLACVQNFEALPNDAKLKHNVALSVFGAIAHIGQSATMRRIEGVVSNAKHDALPVAKFLGAVKDEL